MKLASPINENYAARVVTITTTIGINCKTVRLAIIDGMKVIVDYRYGVGTKGLFFPVGTQLSDDFLAANNLYRNCYMNRDFRETGFFEKDRKVRAININGYKSEGFFIPLKCLLYVSLEQDIITLKERDIFDHVNGIEICRKYDSKIRRTPPSFTSNNSFRKRIKEQSHGM